jgi:hypothetical protein
MTARMLPRRSADEEARIDLMVQTSHGPALRMRPAGRALAQGLRILFALASYQRGARANIFERP